MESAKIIEPALLLSINERYRTGMTGVDLYDATRGVWRAKRERLSRAKLAFAIFQGQIVGAYSIDQWHPAGTTTYSSGRTIDRAKYSDRWEFIGVRASKEIMAKYIGRQVSRSWGNPVRYINV